MSDDVRIISFGAWRLDVDRKALFVEGKPVRLQPGAMRLLLYVAEREGDLISKVDLVSAVWGKRDVADAAIYSRVKAVRRAIQDEDGARRCLRWEYGQGLRFARPNLGGEPASTDAPDPHIDHDPGYLAAMGRLLQAPAAVNDSAGLRSLLGIYHIFFRTPSWPGAIQCGVCVLTEVDGRGIVRTAEHGQDEAIGVRQRARYRGRAQLINDRLYVSEQNMMQPHSLCLSALDAPHVFRPGLMAGLMLGSSWRLGGAPYATRVVWRRIPATATVRQAIRQSGPIKDNRSDVEPAIRESLGSDCLTFRASPKPL